MVRFKKGTRDAGVLILALSLASSCPVVSRVGETGDIERVMETGEGKRAEAPENVVAYGPGSYVIGENTLPGEYAVFTEDTSEHNACSTCTITLYKDDMDAQCIGTFQFQHHEPVPLYKGRYLVATKGYATEVDRADITPGTTGIHKVGWDTEPGTYRITSLTSGSGYYTLYSDVRHYYDYIGEYAVLFEPVTVDITSGQYLELFNARSIERVSD